MSIIDEVNNGRDLEATLNRSLSVLVQLYTSAPHFIFELLQNAEDCRASRVLFCQYPDRLEFYHNGRPFTERNLRGLTDVGLSDKLPENNQIGKFGVGFKSVYTICRDVYVASEPAHWNKPGIYQKFSAKIVNFVHLEEGPEFSMPDEFTTAFVFPYATNEKYNGYRSEEELRSTIAQKLQDIGALSLLFLSHIKSIGYKIELDNIERSGDYSLAKKPMKNASFSLVQTVGNEKGGADAGSGSENVQYLQFSRPCSCDLDREVSIAFEVTAEKDVKGKPVLRFCKSAASCISSYFPTGTQSGVNFIVNGPFVTTPNRSEILADNSVNNRLVRDVSALLHDAILELCEHKFVTPEFINILPFDDKVFKNLANPLLAPLVAAITKMVKAEKVLPTEEGGYVSGAEACIGRNNDMVRLFNNDSIARLINDGANHAWLSTQIKQFCEYDSLFYFLVRKIGVPFYTPDELRPFFNKNKEFLKDKSNRWLSALYEIYSSMPNSFDERSASSNMLSAAIIKTASGDFVSARRDDGKGNYIFNVFRPVARASKDAENMVDPVLYKDNRRFFDEILKLPAPGGYDLFVSDFVERYSTFTPPDDDRHIADVKELIRYTESPATKEETRIIAEEHLKLYGNLKANRVFRNPVQSEYMMDIADTGDSLVEYYDGIDHSPCFVDLEFYRKHGIKESELLKLGVKDEIIAGLDVVTGKDRKLGEWSTLGKFRYEFMIDRLPEILVAIQDRPQASSSRIKSKMVFQVLKEHKDALKGKLRLDGGKASEELTAKALAFVLNEKRIQMAFWKEWRGAWLYTKDGVLAAPSEITKDDLDVSLYGKPDNDNVFYETLGLKYNSDQVVEAEVKAMPQTVKDRVFEEELQRRVADPSSRKALIDFFRSGGTPAKALVQQSDESFPVVSVVNLERLRQHAAEQLAYADPVRFEHRKRSIRVSSIAARAKEYLGGNYSLSSGKMACQMCHKFVPRTETVEMFLDNDLELEPMHLCLCRNCSPDYREIRGDEDQSEKFREKIEKMDDDVVHSDTPVEVRIGKSRIWFTPLHFAEVKMLLELMK